MKRALLYLLFILLSCSIFPQEKLLGGPCEGCEAVFEYGNKILTPVDTLPDFNNPGPKLKVTGTIYRSDEKTPAANVILYIYHTNQKGIYETRGNKTGWGRRHGYIRGWIKTDKNGRYTFYTLKPGRYHNGKTPAHIHGILLEPDGNYYWIDSWHFKGDSLLDLSKEQKRKAYGGSGIVELKKEGNILIAYRNIILGKNVPGYK